MKRLITLLFFAFFAISSYGQVQPNLPPGTVPFGTGLFRATDGDIWSGSKFDGYVNLGNWERVADSLGVKINWSDTTIIATKTWVAEQINNLPPSGVLSVTGDGVDNTDAANPVISYPTPADIGALAPGDNISQLTNDVPYLITETDPVYSGDPASGITQPDIDSWDAKQAAITGGATTITTANLTVNRALISNGSGKVAVSPVSSTELAFIDGVTSNVQTQLNSKVPTSDVGASGGVAPLGGDGKVPGEYLPSSGSYKGTWDASTNTPTIADGVGTNGDRYRVSVGGSQDLGSGTINFVAGDDVIYNGSVWQRSPSGVTVTSVNGKTGDVIVTKADVGLGDADNTSDLDKPVSTAVQAALGGKENTFSKGNLIAGDNITLSGDLTERLVGAGDVTVNVDAGSIGLQTLSLGTTPGNIVISDGNSINLTTLLGFNYQDFGTSVFGGLLPVYSSSGSTGYPLAIGSGIFRKRSHASDNNTDGSFVIWKNAGNDGKLLFNVGIASTSWKGWETFASEEFLSANYLPLTGGDVTGNVNITASGFPHFQVNGSFAADLQLRHTSATADEKLMILRTANGVTQFNSYNDDGSVRLSGILSLDHATGVVSILGNTIWHAGNFDPSDYLEVSSPAGSITQQEIDNWNEAAQYSAPETVITTSVNFTINWQTDIAPNSGGKTYAEAHGNHFVYSAFYSVSGGEVNYSPAVKINRDVNGDITTVEFGDIQNGGIIIK